MSKRKVYKMIVTVTAPGELSAAHVRRALRENLQGFYYSGHSDIKTRSVHPVPKGWSGRKGNGN